MHAVRSKYFDAHASEVYLSTTTSLNQGLAIVLDPPKVTPNKLKKKKDLTNLASII